MTRTREHCQPDWKRKKFVISGAEVDFARLDQAGLIEKKILLSTSNNSWGVTIVNSKGSMAINSAIIMLFTSLRLKGIMRMFSTTRSSSFVLN
jgi:hypothetical protein